MSVEFPRHRKIVDAGRYEAWLVAVDSPKENHSAGSSAHGWEIRRSETKKYDDRDIACVDHASEENNGYVTGAYRIVEATPDHSEVHIWTLGNAVVLLAKDNLDALRQNDFRRADGKPVALDHYWREIDKLCRYRHIKISSGLLKRSKWEHDQIYKLLMRDTRAALKQRQPQRPGR